MPVRFGIISAAGIAEKVVGVMKQSKHAEFVCVGARDLEKAKAFALKNNIPRAYGTYEEVLSDKDVQAVYIPVPTALRLEWVIKAANAKKHVLVEKPFASADQVKQMQEACISNGVHFMDNTMHLHHLRTKYVEEKFLNSNGFELHRVNNALSYYTMNDYPTNIRFNPKLEPLGALGDLGWYTTRNILWAFKYQLPVSVTASGHFDDQTGTLMDVSAILNFPNNKTATFNVSFKDVTRQHTELVSAGTLIRYEGFVLPFENEPYVFPRESYNPRQTITVGDVNGNTQTVTIDACDQVIKLFEQYEKDVANEESIKKAQKWAEESVRTSIVLDAVLKSIKTNTTVSLQ
ncbi:hypothetical protein AKO1_006981 [Acrasis kona]|uniref:Uncharacterized protein n=1 Tax=Acrasis kona TaxID=1008807 RepID=A0AAW2YUD4_9EUKA